MKITDSKLKLAILICFVLINYSGFSQISPIPKLSFNAIENVAQSKSTRNKPIEKDTSVQDSLNISDLEYPQLIDTSVFDAPTSKLISDAIDKISNSSDNSKDTTLFTQNGYTIYIYSNANKIKLFYYPFIDDKKMHSYKLHNKYYYLKQHEYNSTNAEIDSLITNTQMKGDDKSKLESLEANREKLQQELSIIKNQIDSINDDISFNWEYNKCTWPIFYSFYKERNNISKIFNKNYYGRSDLSVLQSLEIGRSANNVNLNTELANAFFRTFRISLAANINVSDNNDSTASEEQISDYQKLMTNGGQLALRVQVPILFYRNSQDDVNISLNFLNRLGFDLIPDDQNANNSNVNNYIGGDISFFLKTEGNVFGFFAYMPFGYSFGNTKFYSNYSFRDFSLVQLHAGVTVHQQFRIKFSGPLYSTQKSLQNVPWTIGFQFTPPSNGK